MFKLKHKKYFHKIYRKIRQTKSFIKTLRTISLYAFIPIILFILFFFFILNNQINPSIIDEQNTKDDSLFQVKRIIDGDTIQLTNNEIIRYIGINTPEKNHSNDLIRFFAQKASRKNQSLVEGKFVRLEKDISDKDRHGRLLRYVWIGELLINDYLIREGYAYVYTLPPNVKYSTQFTQAESEARANKKGLWGL